MAIDFQPSQQQSQIDFQPIDKPSTSNINSNSSKPNLGDLAWDTYAREGMGAYDAMKWLPGVKQLANLVPGTSADELSANLDKNATLGQKIAKGTGQAVSTIPQVIPFIETAGAIPALSEAGKFGLAGLTAPTVGMAGYGATKAAATGQPILPAAAQGAGQGLTYGLGSMAGSAVSQAVFNPLANLIKGNIGGAIAKAAPTVGSAAGSAGAGALLAPDDEKASSAIVGGALGAFSPIGDKSYDEVLKDATEAHQKMLNIGKGTIQKVEMKSGKDLQDSYELAAKHGLIYNKFEGNKTDTTQAQQQIQPIVTALHNQADAIVSSDPSKTFDLNDWADQAKADLAKNPKFKIAKDLNDAKGTIDDYVKAEILNNNNSPIVSAPKLNEIKQGMWGKSFEPLQPNANAIARQMGNSAKDMIEGEFPDVASVNKQLGKYLDLRALLINAHGNTVPNGKLGKGWAGGIGAATGVAASHFAPNPEVAGMMALGGTKAGMMISDHMNDPANISKSWANKIKLSQMKEGIDPNPNTTSNPQAASTPIAPQNPNQNPTGTMQGTQAPASGILTSPFNPLANKSGTILGTNGQPMNASQGIKALAVAGALGVGSMLNTNANAAQSTDLQKIVVGPNNNLGSKSVLNPLNNPTQTAKKQEVLQMPAGKYTMTNEGKGVKGKSGWPYIDTLGNKTVGYGFKMDGDAAKYIPLAVKQGRRAMTEAEMTDTFNKIYPNAIARAEKFAGPAWSSLSPNQQKVLADMSYQMENHLNGFHNLKAAIQSGHFSTAAKEILDSKYARKDAPERAKQNAILIQQ